MTGSGGQLLPDLLLCSSASLVALVTTVLVLCRKKKSRPPAGPRTPFGPSEDTRTPSLIEFDKFPYDRGTRDLSATKVEKVEDKKLYPIGNDQFLNAKGEVVRAACDDETILDIKGDFGKVQAVGMKEATVSGAQLEQRPQHAPDEISCPAIIPEKVEKLDEKSFDDDQDDKEEEEVDQKRDRGHYKARDRRREGRKYRGSKSRGSKMGRKPSRKSRQENMKKRSKKYDDDDRERDEDRRDRDDDMRRRKRDDKDNDDRRSDYDKKKDR
ncbi:hypothetical protein PRIPAC_74621 [Pristionchus pacificus]|uniref:Uncharacterized protein n=1 Tax=Pristionchus pacificus TaxID=54126 RepID=A0A2A6C7K2_PRIPA|nr:hypothetical protein PRIPAC_74621 [Pristionchus pacificus]|eukprot:PDM74080.1 hypothetical protein PRIPAC_41436 [Pristionchus pacificus]